MRAVTDKLAQERLDGETLSLGCLQCPLRGSVCGGLLRQGGGWDCMDECARCDKATCSKVCLKRPSAFAQDLIEVSGFHFAGLATALRQPGLQLPQYLPVVQHGYGREAELPWPMVAVPLGTVRTYLNTMGTAAVTPDSFRRWFKLAPTTNVVLLGTGTDKVIERYWRDKTEQTLTRRLLELGFCFAVAPNYSFELRHSRPHHFVNRKRSLLLTSAWSSAGLPTVTCLQAVTDFDWEYWYRYLCRHEEISVVAEECQTGDANPTRAIWALDSLARLQDRLRRRLHPIAIGGTRLRSELSARFDSWTASDSTAFMKAYRRQRGHHGARRIRWESAIGEPVDDLLYHNIAQCAQHQVPKARLGQEPAVPQGSTGALPNRCYV